ncbi:hypothetical protein NQ318_017276, partial [Aromia moschata]
PRPLDIFLKAIPYRLIFGFVAAFLVWITPTLLPDATQGLPLLYVVFLLVCYALHQVPSPLNPPNCSKLAFLGGNWPGILALYFVDPLTWKECQGGTESMDNTCRNALEKELCVSKGGKCVTTLDGFYVETAVCAAIGVLWLLWGAKKIRYVQSLSHNVEVDQEETK